MRIQSSVWFGLGMSNPVARVLVCLLVLVVGCYGCPNHCLCYTWGGLVRTDCIGRNLFNTFVGFSHLTQVLDLSHNVITILHGNEFLDANLRRLQDLRLSNNQLHLIDKLSFNGLFYLRNLDLSHNSIEYLNPSTFKHNPNLKTLNVSFNPLSLQRHESFLSGVQSLQVLDLAGCRLESVTSRSFMNLGRLALLNISGNGIRKIEQEFLDGVKTLKYLDVSKNDFPCNDQSDAFLRTLVNLKIQFRGFCERSQRMVMFLNAETKETDQPEADPQSRSYSHQNTTTMAPRTVNGVFKDITRFFQSISASYAVVCGIHVGVLIGALSTYLCMRKAMRKRKTNVDLEEVEGETSPNCVHDSDNVNLALIPLHTPPGTPPSPYHSRFFPSTFSLSAT